MHAYSSTDTAAIWKISRFLLWERSNFPIIDKLSIAVYVFPMHMLTSLSVDEILLSRYLNWSTNFRGLRLRVEMASSCLKHLLDIFMRIHGSPVSSITYLSIYCLRGLRNRSKRVRTPVVLLRSLSDKYPPSYGLNSTTTVLLGII